MFTPKKTTRKTTGTRSTQSPLVQVLAVGVLLMGSMAPAMAETKAGSVATTEVNVTSDGLYTEAWMMQPASDLQQIFKDGLDEGKYVAILWSSPHCKSARRVHETVLSEQRVSKSLPQMFNVYQMNLKGQRLMSLPSFGMVSEKKLAKSLSIKKSPTLVLFKSKVNSDTGMPDELVRLSGKFSIDRLTDILETVNAEEQEAAALTPEEEKAAL